MLSRRELLLLLASSAVADESKDYRILKARVEPLWKSPDGHANALEATDEGLWVGEQITDIAYLLDWRTGKVLQELPTDSSNTSGIACGGGYLWMGANGPASRREKRETDAKSGEVIKIDPKTGKTVARYLMPGGGGVHGLTWVENSLWITTLKLQTLTRVDVNFNILHTIPVTLGRAHGLAWDNGAIWSVFSDDIVIQKLDAKDGGILEAVQLAETDPEPHGMTRYQGSFYYCNAGVGPRDAKNKDIYPGYICQIHL